MKWVWMWILLLYMWSLCLSALSLSVDYKRVHYQLLEICVTVIQPITVLRDCWLVPQIV